MGGGKERINIATIIYWEVSIDLTLIYWGDQYLNLHYSGWYVGLNKVHLFLEQIDRTWLSLYVEMIQHGLHINKAWAPYGSPAHIGMHAVQLNIRSGKTGAG